MIIKKHAIQNNYSQSVGLLEIMNGMEKTHVLKYRIAFANAFLLLRYFIFKSRAMRPQWYRYYYSYLVYVLPIYLPGLPGRMFHSHKPQTETNREKRKMRNTKMVNKISSWIFFVLWPKLCTFTPSISIQWKAAHNSDFLN